MRKVLIEYVPGLVGGVVGGVLGYFASAWLRQYGLWAPVIPGALTGLGCGLASRTDSNIRGGLVALMAAKIGLISNWRLFNPPFETDGTLVDYLKHAYQLPAPTLLMLGLGAFLGYWWGRECTLRGRLVRRGKASEPTEA